MKKCQKFETEVVANPAATRQVDVEIHPRNCDKINPVGKLNKQEGKRVEDVLETVDTPAAAAALLKLLASPAQATPGRRTVIEIASFDNVFSPYIKPPI